MERKKIESALTKKGFVQTENDHHFFHLEINDLVEPIYTKTSHGTKYKRLGPDLISKMARQIRLSKSQFHQYVQCTISKEMYVDILKRKNLISKPGGGNH